MDRLALVVLVFLAGMLIGGLGWERYQLRDANSEWKQALKRKDDATTQALAAERRLAEAQTKRSEAAKVFEARVKDAPALDDCPIPDDVAGMLAAAADETRAN